MNKLHFITSQLSKAQKKKYESYVISRIWHQLNNLDIKFVTQQYVRRGEDRHALTDMYFPQFDLHIEVDEPYHLLNSEADRIREMDIINATNHKILRVNISEGLESIHKQVDYICETIRSEIDVKGATFVPWDIEKETNPQTYIDLGYISLKDNVSFSKSFEACNCFGYDFSGFMRGGVKHKYEKNTLIWFPKLYPNGEWVNNISSNEKVITERHIDPIRAKEHLQYHINSGIHRRIVFAKVKGPLGDIMYRFKGAFELDIDQSLQTNQLYWKRAEDTVKTYKAN